MHQLARCLVCGVEDNFLRHASTYSGDLENAHRYFLANREASAHGDIRQCRSCGFVFTSPQFGDAEYDRIYTRIGEGMAPGASSAGPGAAANERRFRRLRDHVLRSSTLDSSFVDFGCGDGTFLEVAGSAKGIGFEIGRPGHRAGPAGTKIVCGQWPSVAGSDLIPWESQSFVTAFDVFEHLPNLERDVALIRRVIRPGGHLYVTVPDIESVMARLTGRRWNMLLLEHLWYFGPKTLNRFLERFGFAAVENLGVPYDASAAHTLKRVAESAGFAAPKLPSWLQSLVVPVPAGVLFAAYRKTD